MTIELAPLTDEKVAEIKQTMHFNKDNPRSVQTMKTLAHRVLSLIVENDFFQVKLEDFLAYGEPSCSKVSQSEREVFSDAEPDENEYLEFGDSIEAWDSDYDEWFDNTIKAQAICAECPLQIACLASSFSTELSRKNDILINYERSGIWGGRGVSVRRRMLDEIIDIWSADESLPRTGRERVAFKMKNYLDRRELLAHEEKLRRAEADNKYEDIRRNLDATEI